jgi:ribosomal 50S subunit-recycling heat shock protein
MKRPMTTAALVIAATLLAAVSASAEILPGTVPTRAEYVAEVEPVCQKNTDSNKPILKAARQKVNAKNLKGAGADFFKVSANFGKALKAIEAVPRPTEDSARLEKWFQFLRIVKTNLRMVGKALKEENKVKAAHEKIRAERSSNAANNVSFVFGFSACRLSPAQFK